MSIATLARKTKTLQRGRSDKRGLILNMTGRGGGIGLSGLSYKYRGNRSNECGGKCRQGGAETFCSGKAVVSQPATQLCYGNYINRRSQAAHRPGGKACCTKNNNNNNNKIIWKPNPDMHASEITEHRKQATLQRARSAVVRTDTRIGDTLLYCKITAKPTSCVKHNKCIKNTAIPIKGRLAYARINKNDCNTTKQVEMGNCASDHTNTAKQQAFLYECDSSNKDPSNKENKKCNYFYQKPTATGNCKSDKNKLNCYRSGEKCITDKNWTQLDNIKGSTKDGFGWVVSLSSDGNTMAIGAPFSGEGGYVRVYKRNEKGWNRLGVDLTGGGGFGWAVSLSSDGNTMAIIIDAPWGEEKGGYVRVYKRNEKGWNPLGGDLKAVPRDGFPGIGTSVSLSSDGNIMAIGAPSSFSYKGGYVRVYKQNGTEWTPLERDIKGPTGADDGFGASVSLSSDGKIMAIGNPGDKGGYVIVYKRIGTEWTPLGRDIKGVDDGFGASVSLSSDGNTMAIGLGGGHVGVFNLAINYIMR